MLLGSSGGAPLNAPKLLLIKAHIEKPEGEASAPSLGTLYLGATARAVGWDVRCIDTYLEADPEGAIAAALQIFPARVVGLSALTAESLSMHRFAQLVRRLAPSVTILVGGPHASAEPEETARNPAVDAVVIGEGEATLAEILTRIQRGEGWDDVAGLTLRKSGHLNPVRTAPRAMTADMDSLPMPAWDLTDIDAYAKRRGMSLAGIRRYVPISTSRGCPYRCTYCHDIHGKTFRGHSPAYVLKLVKDLRQRFNVTSFDITDDIFNWDPARMLEICDGFVAEDADITFTLPNGVRGDRLKVEHVHKLADAGCEYVAIAIETVTPRLQKQIRKNLRFDKAMPVLAAFAERNVLTAGFFMLGFRTETEAEMRATIDFALRSKLHTAFFFVVTPFGGTEMFNNVVDTLGAGATELGGTGMYWRPKHNLSEVPDAKFTRIRQLAYLRFYADPRRILRIWRAHPRKHDLVQYAWLTAFRDTLSIIPGTYLGPLRSGWRAVTRLVSRAPSARPAAEHTKQGQRADDVTDVLAASALSQTASAAPVAPAE